ncbi:MAG: efflux RND transporter permease subunit, partial [Planctomycetales bacterium]|nr:efflux RND transporter permease subunit [Planctomycetales bacterium]
LLVNLMAGYTINRVTLFALILALGLLVDDPIVAVENIYRHLTMRKKRPIDAISDAMNEVMPPIVLSTLTVMVAFLPMFFITGMMGPYMRPMALNVPLAMFSSMLVSLMITPWVSSKMLKNIDPGKLEAHEAGSRGGIYHFYSKVMTPYLESRAKSRMLMLVMGILFAGSVV